MKQEYPRHNWKDSIYKWWMCDFCGGMADPINEGMFWSCVIGAGIGILLALTIL